MKMSQGKKVRSADNQQERLDNSWISGSVDGEGCFHIAINKLQKMTLGYQVLPEFRLVQHKRDVEILYKIQKHLNVGVVRKNHSNRFELRVRSLSQLNKLTEFFEENPLQTKKKDDFRLFKKVINLMNDRKHLTNEGLNKIAKIASKTNRQKERVI